MLTLPVRCPSLQDDFGPVPIQTKASITGWPSLCSGRHLSLRLHIVFDVINSQFMLNETLLYKSYNVTHTMSVGNVTSIHSNN